jgi:hypothetical protein
MICIQAKTDNGEAEMRIAHIVWLEQVRPRGFYLVSSVFASTDNQS